MASLRDIKKRISSVKNTQKITKAMKMVAAAKLRRAQVAVVCSRPYSEKLKEVVMDIVSHTPERKSHPIFDTRPQKKSIAVLVFSSNRGLCGGFNSNMLRRAYRFIQEQLQKDIHVDIHVIGKKGRDYFAGRGMTIASFHEDWAVEMPYEQVQALTMKAVEAFVQKSCDGYYLLFNKFVSAISQEPQVQCLLPLQLDGLDSEDEPFTIDYIYEPSKTALLEALLPKYLAAQVYKAHLESLASELGARMTAMDNATGNASDMIGRLTLQYNRARQAAITTELMDIVNGAESIK